MRKLTTLAATTLAAAGLMAAIAAPANADRPFQITDQNNNPCDPFCQDTGYAGTFNIGSATCDADFDMRIDDEGALVAYNLSTHCDTSSVPNVVTQCDWEESWTGQVRYPNSGAPKIDLHACLYYHVPGMTGYHDITVNVFNAPRRWEQIGTGTGTNPITNAVFFDSNQPDNVKAVLL